MGNERVSVKEASRSGGAIGRAASPAPSRGGDWRAFALVSMRMTAQLQRAEVLRQPS